MATEGNDFITVLRYGQTATLDGLGGVDTLNFDRLARSKFTITQGSDGYINVDTVSGASSTFHFKLINVEKLSFSSGRDIVDLTTLFPTGTDGNDSFQNSSGNDYFNGKGGIDTLACSGARASFSTVQTASGYTLADNSGASGSDTLVAVERIMFADSCLALDLDGHAGQVAKLLGAVFGASSVANPTYVGAGLSLLDGGMSYQDLGKLAIEYAGKTSHTQIVETLWKNVVGSTIPAAEKSQYVSLLSSGSMSVGDLVTLAADTSLNASNIDLVGLAQTGLAYAAIG